MICKTCGNEMKIDDVDIVGKGKYDNYHICENCGSQCLEQVRGGKCYKVHWVRRIKDAEINEDTEFNIF